MSPLENPQEAAEFTQSKGGKFFNPKEMELGSTWNVNWTDVAEYHGTPEHKIKYPIAGKDYCYRIKFIDPSNDERIWDINGKDITRQIFKCLYPNGTDKPISPCRGTLHRRTERSTKQSSMVLVRVDGEVKPSEDVPF